VTFTPRLDILPPSQRALWQELSSTPDNFILYGGTALALRLGHRQSVDFDFFTYQPIDPAILKRSVPYLREARTIDAQPNTLTCLVDRSGPVKVSFFGLPNIRQCKHASVAPEIGLRIASLHDIAGTKAQAVQSRAAAKDYIDIDALITLGRLPLFEHLSAARAIFGDIYEPFPTLKALAYFGDVPDLPQPVRQRLLRAVDSVEELFDVVSS
jgi:hypothetical protein